MMLAREPIHTLTRWVTPQVRRVVAALAACEVCGGISFGPLCADCRDKSHQHVEDDPYDVVGGEGGGWS
jgi:hypothetical protein